MGYHGDKFAPFFNPAPIAHSMREMADEAGERFLDVTVQNTPIDSGNLRTSWRRKHLPDGVKRVPTPLGHAYESGVETEVEYAPHVEHGTGLWGPNHAKYRIRAKDPDGFLAFPARTGGFDEVGSPETGGMVFRREVWHPGSPGAHMLATAAAIVEHEAEQIVRGSLMRLIRVLEAQADS